MMVGDIEDDGGGGKNRRFRVVYAQIKHRQTPTLDLGAAVAHRIY